MALSFMCSSSGCRRSGEDAVGHEGAHDRRQDHEADDPGTAARGAQEPIPFGVVARRFHRLVDEQQRVAAQMRPRPRHDGPICRLVPPLAAHAATVVAVDDTVEGYGLDHRHLDPRLPAAAGVWKRSNPGGHALRLPG